MSNDAQPGQANAEANANGNAAPTLATFTLENILSEHHDKIEASSRAEGWDEETADKPVLEGYCVECEGTPLRPNILFISSESHHLVRLATPGYRPACRLGL